jgi:hypothetical protein
VSRTGGRDAKGKRGLDDGQSAQQVGESRWWGRERREGVSTGREAKHATSGDQARQMKVEARAGSGLIQHADHRPRLVPARRLSKRPPALCSLRSWIM